MLGKRSTTGEILCDSPGGTAQPLGALLTCSLRASLRSKERGHSEMLLQSCGPTASGEAVSVKVAWMLG